jgi:hypothetical protein
MNLAIRNLYSPQVEVPYSFWSGKLEDYKERVIRSKFIYPISDRKHMSKFKF